MNKGHKLLSLSLCAAVLLTLIGPAALAEGETLPENEVVLSKTPAASAAQEGASGEAAQETPAPQATPRPQESQAAGESPETTPAESPAESPKESPAESPKESPAESPKESPAESPKESPAQTPAGKFTISYDYNGGAAGTPLMLNAAQNGENAAQGGENAAQNGENAAPAPTAESVTGNSGQTIVLANAPIKPERDFADGNPPAPASSMPRAKAMKSRATIRWLRSGTCGASSKSTYSPRRAARCLRVKKRSPPSARTSRRWSSRRSRTRSRRRAMS